jgi:ubiquinone/menaquinone biosynthesis C-methylase UbiE
MPDRDRTRIREEFSRQAPHFAAAPALRLEADLERIARAVGAQPTESVLDLACGAGVVTARLAQDAGDVVGVDLTPEMLRRAQALCATLPNVRLELADIGALPFEDARFDAAVCRLVLHHCDDPGRVLDEMLRVVRPGGRVVVGDILTTEDPVAARRHNRLERLRDPSHVRMLPADEHRRLLRERGASIEAEESWTQERRLGEWLAITGAPGRRDALRSAMSKLVDGGVEVGIGLRREAGDFAFSYQWLLLRASRA